MQDRIAARDIKIRQTAVYLAEVKTVVIGIPHLIPIHGVRVPAAVLRKYVAVLAALIAFVSDMPLEGKIFFHIVPLFDIVFSIKADADCSEPVPGKE